MEELKLITENKITIYSALLSTSLEIGNVTAYKSYKESLNKLKKVYEILNN